MPKIRYIVIGPTTHEMQTTEKMDTRPIHIILIDGIKSNNNCQKRS